MATVAQIRAAIVAQMLTVPDIGHFHDRERYAKNKKDLLELYQVDLDGAGPEKKTEVRGGYLVRRSTTVKREDADNDIALHEWQLRYFLSFDDERNSELAFDAKLDSMRAIHSADLKLGGLVFSPRFGQPTGLQLIESGPVMFCNTLCHGARLKLETATIEERWTDVGPEVDALDSQYDTTPENETPPIPLASTDVDSASIIDLTGEP